MISYPGTVNGTVSINDNNSFASGGAVLRRNLCCKSGCYQGCPDPCHPCFQPQNCCRLDFISGFRYYQFNDNLQINEHLVSTSTTNGVPVGTVINVSDSFRTQNNFYGYEFGLILDRYYGRWMYELGARCALGNNNQLINVNGSTVVTYPGYAPAVSQGGLYAQSSNIGTYKRNEFMAIPQISARIGYRVTNRLTLLVGYTFIYWGQIARAADQIDTTINTNLIPPAQPGGPNRPGFPLNESNFWAQGITAGLEYHF